MIVIGGGVGNIDEIYTEGVERVKKYIFNPRVEVVFSNPVWEIVPVSLVRLCCDDCAHNSIKQTLNHSIIVVFKGFRRIFAPPFPIVCYKPKISHSNIRGNVFVFPDLNVGAKESLLLLGRSGIGKLLYYTFWEA